MAKASKIYDLDLDRLQEVLDYDPDTGVFLWRIRLSPRCKFGVPAGQINTRGYRVIGIDGKSYLAHQLAWFYFYGEPPETEIDFENRQQDDIRIDNLRLATRQENARNANRPPNKTGVRGVKKFYNRYHSQIRIGGKRLFLGTFETAAEAHAAYCRALWKYHGKFAWKEQP